MPKSEASIEAEELLKAGRRAVFARYVSSRTAGLKAQLVKNLILS
jgi:hypothetical protein